MDDLPAKPVIVCIDDEAAILGSLARMLRNEPYEFLTTQNPGEAVDWILQKEAHLVIADQQMPSVTGFQLLEIVKACSPRTIRVMLTGHSDLTGILKQNKIDTIERLVRKPWDPQEFKQILRDLLAPSKRSARPDRELPKTAPEDQAGRRVD